MMFPTSAARIALSAAVLLPWQLQAAERQVIEPRLVHLRNDPAREWSFFPENPDALKLEIHFQAAKNAASFAVRLRQQDVKQLWRVSLNGKPLGELVRDENDQVIYLQIPAAGLQDGDNLLRIESPSRGAALADDIRVGELWIEPRSVREVLSEATLEIEVVDADTQSPLPSRITIADLNGALHSTAAVSDDHLAVRPGVIYTTDGKTRFGVPAGKYVVYAGRGFEYSLAQAEVTPSAGETVHQKLSIRREVPTAGYVACDTHIHTLTHSGHGDATITERMITLAGEGIELPIATDHNIHIDYEPHARALGVRRYFTPVIGNEVTTDVGHFNIFPIAAGSRIPDFKKKTWSNIFDEIFATPGVKIAILNHARDVHSGTRPFDPERFNATIGENTAGWPMRASAMETINSGATQTDPLRLFRDWMALLNRGYMVTPAGSSDSHDVSRYIVGQGRTYIRLDDRDVSQLDVNQAVDNFLAGRVLVSYGLIADLAVSGKYRGGDLAAVTGDEIPLDLQVLGPHWTTANRVQLYANGQLVREEPIPASAADSPLGVKWHATWKIPRPKHDVHLVLFALGPGITAPYWPTAKPYQPTSPDWQPYTLGASGAVWIDADSDGQRSSARGYAERNFIAAKGDIETFIELLRDFDAAIAAQAAHLLHETGHSLESAELARFLNAAPTAIQEGFRSYQNAWRAGRNN